MLGEGASNIFVIIHAAANSFLSALEQLLQSVLAGSCRPVYNWKKITVLVKGGTQATTHMYYTIVNKILRWDDKKSTKKNFVQPS